MVGGRLQTTRFFSVSVTAGCGPRRPQNSLSARPINLPGERVRQTGNGCARGQGNSGSRGPSVAVPQEDTSNRGKEQ